MLLLNLDRNSNEGIIHLQLLMLRLSREDKADSDGRGGGWVYAHRTYRCYYKVLSGGRVLEIAYIDKVCTSIK